MQPARTWCLCAVLLGVLLAPIAPGRAAAQAEAMPERGISAHRGGTSPTPENTRAAFCHALGRGVHQIEFDVRRTRDGALVLMHDETVDRTTDGHGRVADLTLAEIRALDAGIHQGPQYANECVPTLEEAFEAMPRNLWLNVDVKGDDALAAEAARRICEAGREHQAVLGAHSLSAALAARGACPGLLVNDMERGLFRCRYVDHTIERGADFIQLVYYRGRPGRRPVERLEAAGVRINYYRSSPRLSQLADLFQRGVDFPLVDEVDAAMDLADRLPFEPWTYDCGDEPCPPCSRLAVCGGSD